MTNFMKGIAIANKEFEKIHISSIQQTTFDSYFQIG